MSTPENEADTADSVEHHHDITDEDLPEDLQPDDNPLAAGPTDDDDDVSAFDPPGKVDGGQQADEVEPDDIEPDTDGAQDTDETQDAQDA